jgi:GntR family transcriptional regulator/MocR family aminotransferase
MDLVLDGNGPLYAQLARAIKAAIASGRIAQGSRLPASRDLAGDLGLSRTTVVTAYEQLRAEGYLQGKVGAGSFVSTPWPAPTRLLPNRRAVLPQSAYSRRARQVHTPDDIPGRRLPGMRHAFQFGLPIVSTTLPATWAREIARAAPYARLNYPATQGLRALREALCAHITGTRGVVCTPDDLLIVNGTQQAMSLIARVLLDPGDEVVMEEPHYFGTRRVFQMHGAQVTGVPVDGDGLCVERLPGRAVKLVCVTPSHQFPTGAVLSLTRRKALLDIAGQCGGWIVEDDYDGEFRYDREALPALQSMDHDGRVVYVGSFSKTLFPALRLGYLIVPPGLRDDFIAAKWADDFGCAPLEQTALANLISNGGYQRHLRLVTRKLVERRDALRTSLQAACGDRLDILPAHAGMHLMTWLRGMNAAQGDALIRLAQDRRLGLYSVAPCYLQPPEQAGLLMGYSAMSVPEIEAAVKLFGLCLDECLQQPAGRSIGRAHLTLAHSA